MPRSRDSPPPEDSWKLVVESLDEGVIVFDLPGRLVSMNQAAEELTGGSSTAHRGRSYVHVFRRNAWLGALIEEALREGERPLRAEGEIRGLWEARTSVRVGVSPIVDAAGRRTGTVVILRDLSFSHDLRSDAERARELEHLGGLVSALAHEIKNPLSGIRGAVQLLGGEIGDRPEARQYVDLVLREVDRLKTLLERLLQVGSRSGLPVGPVNVHRVIDHVVGLVDADARGARVRIVRLFDPSLPPVAGDEDSLIQVVLNLARNALEALAAAPADPVRELRLRTRMETGYRIAGEGKKRLLRLEVEDTGPGVPAHLRDDLFSPFVSGHSGGTGLGLAISHRIVSDHGGTLRFDSEPGRTTFRVLLPEWEEPR